MKKLTKVFAICSVLVLVGAGCKVQEPTVQTALDVVDLSWQQDTQAENIHLFSPISGENVDSPLVITGEARVYENSVDWQILDMNENVLKRGYTYANAPDIGQFGLFEERIFLPTLNEKTFYLEVFNTSAKDGSKENVIRRELSVDAAKKTSVHVYFTDPLQIAGGDCSQVDFEKRTVQKTLNTAELSIHELLEGPTSDWAQTNIPEGTSLSSIEIKAGTAYVDFRSPLLSTWNGGSCHVSALRAQIEQTLLQFDSVQTVSISVNGQTEGILEP